MKDLTKLIGKNTEKITVSGKVFHKGKKNAYYPLILGVISLFFIFIISNYFDLNVRNIESTKNFIAILITAFFVVCFLFDFHYFHNLQIYILVNNVVV